MSDHDFGSDIEGEDSPDVVRSVLGTGYERTLYLIKQIEFRLNRMETNDAKLGVIQITRDKSSPAPPPTFPANIDAAMLREVSSSYDSDFKTIIELYGMQVSVTNSARKASVKIGQSSDVVETLTDAFPLAVSFLQQLAVLLNRLFERIYNVAAHILALEGGIEGLQPPRYASALVRTLEESLSGTYSTIEVCEALRTSLLQDAESGFSENQAKFRERSRDAIAMNKLLADGVQNISDMLLRWGGTSE